MFTARLVLGQCTDGRKGVLQEAGSKQYNMTQAAPHELQLGDGGCSAESWPSAWRWRRRVFVRHRLGETNRRFRGSECKQTHAFGISGF